MLAFARLVVFGFLALSVLYLTIALYLRSRFRERLENHWAERHPTMPTGPLREMYMRRGMRRYSRSLRRKLPVLVYIVPPVLAAISFFLVNRN